MRCFGEENFVSQISFSKTSGQTAEYLAGVSDYILWSARSRSNLKYRQPYIVKSVGGDGASAYTRIQEPDGARRSMTRAEKQRPNEIDEAIRIYRVENLTSPKPPGDFPIPYSGMNVKPEKGYWKNGQIGVARLLKADRVVTTGTKLYYARFIDDFGVFAHTNSWTDTVVAGFASDKRYVVETSTKVVERCLLMTTDPGDLVLDPTCGSGTTAYVAEQWGRRWITVDTSRVALALARARIMGAKYPWYVLKDSP